MYKYSIIIATYNSGKTLEQCLNSIKFQTFTNYELIIVDGGSTDNTSNIVNAYQNIITKYVSEPDNGIYDAFNKGISMATGEYVYFLGSDDCLCNYDVLRDISTYLSSDVDLLSSSVIVIDECDKKEVTTSGQLTKEQIINGLMLPHQGMFVKTEVMKRYYFSLKYKIISDYVFLVKFILDGGKIKYANVPVAFFSTGGISGIVNNKFNLQAVIEHFTYCNEINSEKLDVQKTINNVLSLPNDNDISYHLKQILKIIFMRLGIYDYFHNRKLHRRPHRCDLRKCRWCNRNI